MGEREGRWEVGGGRVGPAIIPVVCPRGGQYHE